MIRFAEAFLDEQIVVTLSRQLGWSHFVEIIPLKDDSSFHKNSRSHYSLFSTRMGFFVFCAALNIC
jgi:hypothetical protein